VSEAARAPKESGRGAATEDRRDAPDRTVLWNEAAAASRQIPPLWTLRDYVAVNPFLGFTDRSVAEAAREVHDGWGGRILPGVDFYRRRWREGAIGEDDLDRAARRARRDPSLLRDVLEGMEPAPVRSTAVEPTVAERVDAARGTRWEPRLIRHVSRWCALYTQRDGDGGESGEGGCPGLFTFWWKTGRWDRSLEVAGLKGWRRWMERLPAEPDRALSMALEEIQVPPAARARYFARLLSGVFGWASYLRRGSWEAGVDPTAVTELLAVRAAADAAVHRALDAHLGSGAEVDPVEPVPGAVEDEGAREVF